MYAVIETGGKQYRVELGTELEVESLDVAPGDDITLDRVLLVADGDTSAIGQPLVANATVAAHVVRHDRGEKVISFKYRPKARRRVKKGHRQELTRLRISDIVLGDRSAAEDARAADAEAKGQRVRLEEAAARQAAADAALAAKLAKAAEAAEREDTSEKAGTAKTAGKTETTAKGAGSARATKAQATKAQATKAQAAKEPVAKAPVAKAPAAKGSARASDAKPSEAKEASGASPAKESTAKKSAGAKATPKSGSSSAAAPQRRTTTSDKDS
ncbi:MAG TPA: 50S ribosomal protein L21 [Candidatus Limnocylindrales bacterium]|jgi:large subunit ribosomal protein L21